MGPLAPLVVEDAHSAQWDASTDVVVVGAGAAGLTTAIEANDHGAEVVVLDRFESGGATAISGGVVYAGGGTHLQAEAGVQDSVENMVRYLSMEVQDAVSEKTLRHFCETSAGNVRWLTDRGVPLLSNLCPVKTSYPTNEYHLYYSGNETFHPYTESAKPAQRGHRTDGGAFPGANITNALRRTALSQDVALMCQARVSRLIVDSAGRVLGAEFFEIPSGFWRALHRRLHSFETTMAKTIPAVAVHLRKLCDGLEDRYGQARRIRARRGVVLCAGGFVFNREMVASHVPAFLPGLALGTAGDDGTGIRLGQGVGGQVKNMHRASAWRFLYPPHAFAEGMLINGRGERFANELWYGSKIGEAMVEHNDGVGTLIIDEHLRKLAHEQAKPGRLQWFQRGVALVNLYFNCKKAKDVAALAAMVDVPADTLRKTLDEYNDAADGLRPDAFHKEPESMRAMRQGPFYAIDCSLGSKRHVCAVMTLGGLEVDEDTGQVLSENGAAITGLYAAGRNATGVCSRQYVSGLSIADCVYSGRRAGRSVASAGSHAGATTKAHHVAAPGASTSPRSR